MTEIRQNADGSEDIIRLRRPSLSMDWHERRRIKAFLLGAIYGMIASAAVIAICVYTT